MSTLADICRAADGPVHTCVDSTTPAGHFAVTTKIVGITTTYLLAGDLGDPQATIVGRIESGLSWLGRPHAYVGAGIKGGQLLFGTSDQEEAFRKMVGANR